MGLLRIDLIDHLQVEEGGGVLEYFADLFKITSLSLVTRFYSTCWVLDKGGNEI